MAGTLMLAFCLAAAAQDAQPPSEPSNPFTAVGRWLGSVASGVKSNMEAVTDKVSDMSGVATDTAKDAAGTVAALPGTRLVTARQKCERAPNGAPDCQAAAEVICRNNGMKGGRSVDIQSAQDCPMQVWLQNRDPKPGECTTNSYVTRAVCQ